ncbi:multiple RNA-binding domain-containing protein 1-like [Rhododendron vialii]|uniref:multiple RNA-binding domain-containing protein 1-like n=1 Tax=Rhododendron vialii TaxID=182163 RepID=UPI0026601700|nr:multiple RNA-binding domain-containing protein 1-like [Rhododendron vialii]
MGRDRANADKEFGRGGTGARNRDGGWIPVISKHRRQMVDSNNSMITLFVDNLPEDVSQRWVSHLFNKFGVVKDVFIPGKRSKVFTGKAFAFVRYDCAVSAEMAISKTNGVWIEDRKLFVKTASFDQKRKELLKHNLNKNASGNIANKKVMGENRNGNFGSLKKSSTVMKVNGAERMGASSSGNVKMLKTYAQSVKGDHGEKEELRMEERNNQSERKLSLNRLEMDGFTEALWQNFIN